MPILTDNGQVQLAINALRRMALARTLAEPTLTTLNGREAQFRAGGQFPVPVVVAGAGSAGVQGVSFVPFGIELVFTPFIVDRDHIRLNVAAQVSTRSAELSGTTGSDSVSGINDRNFSTTVELRDGQTLAVAGLIQNNYGGESDRVPFLGDLPLIGRAAAFDRVSAGEQELLILITPELVKPIEVYEAPAIPGSDVFEPGDIEFYLHGHMEGVTATDARSPVRTDIARLERYYQCCDKYIVGPNGYQCGRFQTGQTVGGRK